MRLALRRTSVVTIGTAVVFGMAVGTPAFATSSQLFAVPSHLVPAAVMAAFMLPATMAIVMSVLKRVGRSPFGLLSLGLLLAGGIAAFAYVNPGFLAGFRV